MFMKQATSDRLLGMLVTLATGAAILYIQHRIKVFVNRRKASGKGERSETKKATDYGDPYFRARWGRKSSGGGGIFELVHHIGACMCGRFGFRLLAPADLKALDCPGRIRYPHVFVPASAFQPLADLRLLTLYSARGGGLASHNVVVHAFCTSCGVPVFRASDGAIDTLVVNIECLRGESVKSLEVTYYEDLLGFPRDDVQKGAEGDGGGGPEQQQRTGSPTWGGVGERGGEKGAWFGAKAGGEGGGSRPSGAATMSNCSNSNAGAIVRATAAGLSRAGVGSEGGVSRWGGKVTGLADAILPFRGLFAASGDDGAQGSSISSSNGCYGRPSSALMGRTGATSLLSHLLSRASLSTCPPSSSSRPLAIETCGHRGLGEEDDDDPFSSSSISSSNSSSPVWPTAGASASMWHAWDESCEVRRERGGRGGGGGGWWTGSSGSSCKTPAMSAMTGLSVPVPGGSVGGGGGGGGIGGGSFYNNGVGAASGWERVSEGCTPPSMHQLRYHLKRHVKRRLSWLNGNGGGGGGDGGMGGGGEDTGFPVDHYFHHFPRREKGHEKEEVEEGEKREEEEQHQQQHQLQQLHHQRTATPPPSAAAAADPFSSPTPSTPLADTTNLQQQAQQQQQQQKQLPSTLPSRSCSDGVTMSKGSIPVAAPVAASKGMRKKQQPLRGENRAPIAKGGKAD